MCKIAEYSGRICGSGSKHFQDGAEGEGGRGLWRPPASNEETQTGRGGEKRGRGPRRGAEGRGKGRQKEASPGHGVYRYLLSTRQFRIESTTINADSCDCEEFGLPLAKRIHGLNLLQTKVITCFQLTQMCEPMIQVDCQTEGPEETGKRSGSSGDAPVEPFGTIYPFPQGTGFKS